MDNDILKTHCNLQGELQGDDKLRFFIFRHLVIYYKSGCKIYLDIMTREKLSSIYVANMDITYWSVRSSSERVYDNLVQDPSNDISIRTFFFSQKKPQYKISMKIYLFSHL